MLPFKSLEIYTTRNPLSLNFFPNRIVRDITDDSEIRYNQDAVEALQTSLEEYATKLFEGSNVLAAVADRDTVYVEDLRNFIKLNNM